MEKLQTAIVKTMAQEFSEAELQKAVQKILLLTKIASHVCQSFVTLAEALEELKNLYGEEPYKEALRILGLEEHPVRMARGHATRMAAMPPRVVRMILKQVAKTTLEQLEVLNDPG